MSKSMDDFYEMEDVLVKEKKVKLKESAEFYGLVLLNIGLFSILIYLYKTSTFVL